MRRLRASLRPCALFSIFGEAYTVATESPLGWAELTNISGPATVRSFRIPADVSRWFRQLHLDWYAFPRGTRFNSVVFDSFEAPAASSRFGVPPLLNFEAFLVGFTDSPAVHSFDPGVTFVSRPHAGPPGLWFDILSPRTSVRV